MAYVPVSANQAERWAVPAAAADPVSVQQAERWAVPAVAYVPVSADAGRALGGAGGGR